MACTCNGLNLLTSKSKGKLAYAILNFKSIIAAGDGSHWSLRYLLSFGQFGERCICCFFAALNILLFASRLYKKFATNAL